MVGRRQAEGGRPRAGTRIENCSNSPKTADLVGAVASCLPSLLPNRHGGTRTRTRTRNLNLDMNRNHRGLSVVRRTSWCGNMKWSMPMPMRNMRKSKKSASNGSRHFLPSPVHHHPRPRLVTLMPTLRHILLVTINFLGLKIHSSPKDNVLRWGPPIKSLRLNT